MTVRAQLLLAIAYPLLVAIVSLAVPLSLNVHDRVSAEVRDQASAQVALIAASAADHGEPGERIDLQALADAGSRQAGGRVLIVDRTGALLADSARSAPAGTSFANRVEIRRALRGRRVQVERHSSTLNENILATAMPIVHRGGPDGAVRVTQSMKAVTAATNRSTLGIVVLAAIVVGLGLLVATWLSVRLARPARRLERAADAVAAGALDTEVVPSGPRELRHLASAFNTMTSRVDELLSSQQRFVADASHQLRTPLAGTRLQLERVQRARDLADARASATVALGEVDRLARTVDELLVLGDEEPPGREMLDLDALVADTAARWEARAAAAGQVVAVGRLDGDVVHVAVADAQRALDVLVENAIAYAGTGAVLLLEASGRCVVVADEGPGLTADDEAIAFERFARGSAGGRAPGSGLGLAIARKLARRNGGDVELRPRTDRTGTIARLRLDGDHA
jgi:signal transduction histidine kinase